MSIETPAASVHTHPHDVYSHPLVSWGAVGVGTLAALATGFTLTALGAAVGATFISPFELAYDDGPEAAIGAGMVIAFSNLVAMQVGGFVAARAARWPDHYHGMLQGLAVWGLSFLVTAVALGGGAMAMVQDVSLSDAAQSLAETGERMSGAPGDIGRGMTESEMESLKEAAMFTGWWAVATMVLGFVGAVAGGYMGHQHPKRFDPRRRELAAGRPVNPISPVAGEVL